MYKLIENEYDRVKRYERTSKRNWKIAKAVALTVLGLLVLMVLYLMICFMQGSETIGTTSSVIDGIKMSGDVK